MLGDELRLTNSWVSEEPGKRFAYPVVGYSETGYDNLGTRLTFEDTYTITVDAAFLDSHIKNDEINIIGAYVRTHLLTVNGRIDGVDNVDSALFENTIQTVIQSPIVLSPNGGNKQFSGEVSAIVDEGSTITITAIEGAYIEYNGAAIEPFVMNNAESEVIDFDSKDLTLFIKAMDNDGNVIEELEDLIIGNVAGDYPNGEIHILDILESITYDDESLVGSRIGGYIFDGFKIKRAIPDADGVRLVNFTVPSNGLAIDKTFLDTYVYNNTVEIDAIFRREFALTIGQPELGSIAVSEKVGADEWVEVGGNNDGKYYFTKDTNIRITATSKVNKVYEFSHFTNIATSEVEGNTASIVVGDDRSIVAVFRTRGIVITTDDKVNFDGGNTKFKVGDVITLEYDLKTNDEIKQWKIGGKSYKDFGDDVSLSGKVLSIRLSEELLGANKNWITANGDIALINIENDIRAGMKTSVLMAILLPSVLIPLALVGFLIMFLMNAKRNKLLKSQIVSDRTEKSKFDISGYMQDLKSGKSVGQVSKEDIKAARKAQIEEAKKARDGGNR
jgi:hypothetical protein